MKIKNFLLLIGIYFTCSASDAHRAEVSQLKEENRRLRNDANALANECLRLKQKIKDSEDSIRQFTRRIAELERLLRDSEDSIRQFTSRITRLEKLEKQIREIKRIVDFS